MKRLIILKMLILSVTLLIASTAMCSQVKDEFQTETLEDETEMLLTPFAEVSTYYSDRDETAVKGEFSSIVWNSDETLLTVKTTDGEVAKFTKDSSGSWSYENRINGKVQESIQKLTWVGKDTAYRISSNIYHNGGEKMPRMTYRDGKLIIEGEDGATASQDFSLPQGVLFKIVKDGKILLIRDSLGYSFIERTGSFFGDVDSRYLIVNASLWKNQDGSVRLMWDYTLGSMSSGVRDIAKFMDKLMIATYERECEERGVNRYGEEELHSSTGKSTIFFNAEKGTGRLGELWTNAGQTFTGTKFIVENEDAGDGKLNSKFLVTITGGAYTAVRVP